MKFKKAMLVTFLLLAILTIGAASASGGADTLAADDGGESLAINDASGEVVANDDSPEIYPTDIEFGVDTEREYSIGGEASGDENFIVATPNNANGTVTISSNGQELFKKALKDFNENAFWDYEDHDEYGIYPSDVNYFNGLKSNDIVTFAFLIDEYQIASRNYKITFGNNYYTLQDTDFNLNFCDPYSPFYLDSRDEVLSIDVWDRADYGSFYVSANGVEYKYDPNFDEDGNSWHNWLLSSFNITEPGMYLVTVKNGKDKDSLSVIGQSYVNVTTFNNDAFRIIEEIANQEIEIFCPDGSEGAVIKIFVKDDWEDEYPETPYLTYTVTSDDYNHWKCFYFDELGLIDEGDDCVYRAEIYSGNDKILERQWGIWYDDDWELFIPNGLTIKIFQDEYWYDDEEENEAIKLYIPENLMIYSGTLEVTSGDAQIFMDELSIRDMEFDDEGRYYRYDVIFQDLNLDNLDDGALMTCTFRANENSQNYTKSFFYLNNDDEGFVQFAQFRFLSANLVRDEDVLQIADFPDGVESTFIIFVDLWGDVSNYTFTMNDLSRDEEGLYTWNCSMFMLQELMYDSVDTGIDFRVQFFMYGYEEESYEGSAYIYHNPWISSGEVSRIEDSEPVIVFLSIPEEYENDFRIVIAKEGSSFRNITLSLSEMDDYFLPYDDEEATFEGEYDLYLSDLGITENGVYDISVQFRENGKDVCYNSTISVVDFVIYTHSNFEYITDAAFRIRLPEESEGRVVLYVNGTEVLNETLSYVGYTDWNRLGGFNIPLNYFQINESGNYDLTLEVYSNDGTLLRTSNSNVDITVGENIVRFSDLIYAYDEENFLYQSELTRPLPVNSKLILYLNGKKAGSIGITIYGFGFWDLDSSFVDEYGFMKPGLYNAKIDLVDGDNVTTFAEGSFRVWTVNGTSAYIPASLTTAQEAYVSLTIPEPEGYYMDCVRVILYVDPYCNEEGFCCDNIIEINGEELFDYWFDDNKYVIYLGRLSAGTHKVMVQYVVERDGRCIDYEFFSNTLSVNVKPSATKIVVKALKTTYNSGKYMIGILRDAKGNPVQNAWVIVQISGGALKKTVTKKIKTNAKGQILFLASGLAASNKYYVFKYTFAGNSNYLKSTASAKVLVVKAAPKLKPTVKVYKVKQKSKVYYVTVTTANNPLKKVKLTLKVNGVTYKAATNAKGIAIFKVTKLNKKGTFQATASLAGTNNYKAATRTFKIVVK